MQRTYFKQLEHADASLPLELTEVVNQLPFNEQGLLPVITQDATSKKALMLAWMNKTSLCQTMQTKRMTYWSRSRECLWIKGETSGHIQSLKSISFDCDGDAILCQVEQVGAACHTGRLDCFYLHVDLNKSRVFVSGKGDL
ncbi:phosphoribosyl-AMP cyclohydrolase [Colwellia psychrerythraea]|uniref:Phosphoribosyl-AMP cyclohydrolase n=1 Tax=Colwellia psychrerythraea TaxID=28229 RepID=A0A099KDA6_COLPS|nr:phosphoribosyl-AMP cyclohydrolase [Colwellia psychrerythraea]KGJ88356.1 Phosphoribosyl-AMP cyclohydrolase [Colwellia psychrerythraea]